MENNPVHLIRIVLMKNTLLNLVTVSVTITFVAVISMIRYWNMIMNVVDTNK